MTMLPLGPYALAASLRLREIPNPASSESVNIDRIGPLKTNLASDTHRVTVLVNTCTTAWLV